MKQVYLACMQLAVWEDDQITKAWEKGAMNIEQIRTHIDLEDPKTEKNEQ